jgi:hypothetical protein
MTNTARLRACALALAVAPALTLAAHLVQATPAQHDTASELASIGAHPGSYQVASALGFLALVLLLPGLLAMTRPLWESRPRWALTGLSMSVLGLLALVSLMGAGPVSLAMAQAPDRDAMVVLTDRYESTTLYGAWVLLMVIGYSLGPVVLAFALWRSGFSWTVPACFVAGLVLTMLDAGRWPLAAGFALTWLGACFVAARLWATATVESSTQTSLHPTPEDAGEPQERAAWSG